MPAAGRQWQADIHRGETSPRPLAVPRDVRHKRCVPRRRLRGLLQQLMAACHTQCDFQTPVRMRPGIQRLFVQRQGGGVVWRHFVVGRIETGLRIGEVQIGCLRSSLGRQQRVRLIAVDLSRNLEVALLGQRHGRRESRPPGPRARGKSLLDFAQRRHSRIVLLLVIQDATPEKEQPFGQRVRLLQLLVHRLQRRWPIAVLQQLPEFLRHQRNRQILALARANSRTQPCGHYDHPNAPPPPSVRQHRNLPGSAAQEPGPTNDQRPQ